MIELVLVLALVFAGGWLLLSVLGVMLKLMFWMIGGALGLVGGMLFLAVALPVGIVLGLVLLPVFALLMLPLLMPLLLCAGLIWLLTRNSRRQAAALR